MSTATLDDIPKSNISSSSNTNEMSNLIKPSLTAPGWETAIGTWLFSIAGMCFGMIVIGGYTRLSGSGLSMTSWKF